MKKKLYKQIGLQLFADAGTLVNASTTGVNAYSGATTPYVSGRGMADTMKIFYTKVMLKNSRIKEVFAQFGMKQSLPRGEGRTVEWHKWNTFPRVGQLTEGVIPTGKMFGMTSITASLAQYGDYSAHSDIHTLHSVDPVIQGAVEEWAASSTETYEVLIRDVLSAATNVIYAPAVASDGTVTQPATRAALITALGTTGTTADITADLFNQARAMLSTRKVPTMDDGSYVCIMHPSVAYHLRKDEDWRKPHEYVDTDGIYNGEIGKLYGFRVIENPLATVIKANANDPAVYQTFFLGKEAFGVIDPEGGNKQMIVKSKGEIGGPLEQFGTVGVKFEFAARILYPERILVVESGSSKFGAVDVAN